MKKAETPGQTEETAEGQGEAAEKRRVYFCDRCGFEMIDRHCKVVCPNCGARWDCSDLSIYTD